jgi:hypothetical protein
MYYTNIFGKQPREAFTLLETLAQWSLIPQNDDDVANYIVDFDTKTFTCESKWDDEEVDEFRTCIDFFNRTVRNVSGWRAELVINHEDDYDGSDYYNPETDHYMEIFERFK